MLAASLSLYHMHTSKNTMYQRICIYLGEMGFSANVGALVVSDTDSSRTRPYQLQWNGAGVSA